jgi:hypothetical protein
MPRYCKEFKAKVVDRLEEGVAVMVHPVLPSLPRQGAGGCN